jgi:hypothetical protein
VGKTRLITHWLANRNIPGFYWLATDSVPGALLRSLSQALYRQIHSQFMLALSGSHIGMMEEGVLAPRSPLYGRATGLLKMTPLPFK